MKLPKMYILRGKQFECLDGSCSQVGCFVRSAFFFFGVLRVNVSFRLEFMYPYILGYTVVM